MIGTRAHDFKLPREELFKGIKTAGFDTMQLAPAKSLATPPSPRDDESLLALRAEFEGCGLNITVLGSYVDMCARNDDAYIDARNTYMDNLHAAKILGARVVGTETSGFRGSEDEREKQYVRLRESVLRIAERAEKEEQDFGIEPVAAHTLNTPELTARLIKEVDSPRLRIVFDPWNLLTADNIGAQRELFSRCFEAFADRVSAIHIKDGFHDARGYTPALLGEGMIDLKWLLPKLREHIPSVDLLREETQPAHEKTDIEFIKRWYNA
ncbi:MAG: sugar phosphate isomerase/epimerase [Eubacteriales bacterium]|nr:sugar phosphate isomerase/epimerase [Eubacteriales bacterium]MDD3882667.1 sugar phosphate isomerase/epimerase [Eubacteriales bacterium]MDD4512761.1 sugar phosphate isomerase/epimerase [Eubacteriales bacterium]